MPAAAMAVWHWQELKLLWALVFSYFGTTEDEVVCELCNETLVAWSVKASLVTLTFLEATHFNRR